MNHNRMSGEDFDESTLPGQVERQLKRMQPRPLRVDIDAVMTAAHRPEASVDPVAEAHKVVLVLPERHRRLTTIAVSWACGALAGVLLTCLWLMPAGDEPLGRVADSPARALVAQSRTSDPPQVIADSLPVDDNLQPTLGVDTNRGDPAWSRSEWLVAAQLSRLGQRQRIDQRPLMAGNYLRLGAPVNVLVIEHPASLDGQTGTPQTNWDESRLMTPPSRVTKADQLLHELLGTVPNGT